MAFQYTKIIKEDSETGFVVLGVRGSQNGDWIELPELKKDSVKFIRKVLEQEYGGIAYDCQVDVKAMPRWTGKELRSFRKSSGLSVQEVASLIDQSEASIWKY